MLVTDEQLSLLRGILPEIDSYICVDVETTGPNPSEYALISIGACNLVIPRQTFYVEIRPDTLAFEDEAMAIHQLSLEKLNEKGLAPVDALDQLEKWLKNTVPYGLRPIFIAFNAPFDWMFVNDYFLRYLGRNPFGHNALDIKAYYMGFRRSNWAQTSIREISHHYLGDKPLTHNALQDAVDQSEMFLAILVEALL